MIPWLMGALLAAAPVHITGLTPSQDVQQLADATWAECEATFLEATRQRPKAARGTIVIERARLEMGRSGRSEPGLVSLRQANPESLSRDERVALKHELAHQFLFSACPAASGDRLFHEAFALSMSGEASAWTEGDYQSLAEAAKVLTQTSSLDTSTARHSLARMLAETQGRNSRLPESLRSRLGRCDGRAAWAALTVEALSSLGPMGGAGALVMSRHTGEVLWSAGDIRSARPFASTLKPFVLAGAPTAPTLNPRTEDTQWACGEHLPAEVTAAVATLRSCNGYFLDWAAVTPGIERFGAWGPVLLAVGLERLPSDMSEAIGLRSTLALSPVGLAAAYRALAEARPDLVTLLQRNAEEGTLAGLDASPRLRNVALKTGTVRDGATRASLGWLVGVTKDLVVVKVVPGTMPRHFADDFAELLNRETTVAGRDAVRVQVFGLVDASRVEVRCQRGGFVFRSGEEPTPLSDDFVGLSPVIQHGMAMCLSAPFEVRLPGVARPRPYAGLLQHDVPAPYIAPPGANPSEKERRARLGSEIVFRTTRLAYVAGVLAAEDASVTGEARTALARVVSHNANTHERHGSRPLCDTTHCQAFKGNVAAHPSDRAALGLPAFRNETWLNFSRGGEEPWQQTRPRQDVERALGMKLELAQTIEGRDGILFVKRTVLDEQAPYESVDEVPCERLRGPLKLPSCPNRVRWTSSEVSLGGAGRGHGLGLDVERAKRSEMPQEEILRTAYGSALLDE